MPYNTDFLPKAVVRIYKSSSVYYDVTELMTSQPVIVKKVNDAGSFKFSVPNEGCLKSSFSGWSDSSTGSVDWGMYVLIENLNSDGTTEYMTDGYITTISLKDNIISFEGADHLAVFGAKGVEIHRNYYNTITRTQWFSAKNGGSDNQVYVDISEIVNNEGTISNDPYYRVSGNDSNSPRTSSPTGIVFASRSYSIAGGYQSTSYTEDWHGYLPGGENQSITLHFRISNSSASCTWTIKCDVYTSGWSYVTGASVTTSSSGDVSLTIPLNGISGGAYIFRIYGSWSNYSHTTSPSYSRLSLLFGSTSAGYVATNGTSTSYPYDVYYTDLFYYNQKKVTAYTVSGSNMIITGITDTTIDSNTKPNLINPALNRALISFISGTVGIDEIMQNICDIIGSGYSFDAGISIPSLRLFRTGGGYALDYMKKLSDCVNQNMNTISFTAKGYSPTVYFGRMRTVADTETFSVEYGVNYPGYAMFSFDPKKTMKNAPSRALVRGTLSGRSTTDKPIIAIVRNSALEGRRGLSTDTVITDSNSLTIPDTILTAYANVNADSEDWSGDLVLSGIVPGVIATSGAFAGSGAVVRITDSRYGFVGKKFLITSATFDYNTLKTSVVLSVKPGRYSNLISDGIAEAYNVGDIAVNQANTTLYNTQFVYISTNSSVPIYNSGNSVSVTINGRGTVAMSDVSVFILPHNRAMVYASLDLDSSNDTNNKYAVESVIINGTTVSIPTAKRPDAYAGQFLIVNVEVPY